MAMWTPTEREGDDMLAWFFSGFWHMLLGFVLLVVFFVGSVIVLARAVAQAAAHDQKTCTCWDCRNRRSRAADKRFGHNKHRSPWDKKTTSAWLTTEELTTALRVVSKSGVLYEVESITARTAGIMVGLVVMASGRKTEVFIPNAQRDRRIWKRAPNWRQG